MEPSLIEDKFFHPFNHNSSKHFLIHLKPIFMKLNNCLYKKKHLYCIVSYPNMKTKLITMKFFLDKY